MKKILLFSILLLLVTSVGYSQQYISLPTNNAYWISRRTVEDVAPFYYYYDMYFFDGDDTTINNNLYYKLKLRAFQMAGATTVDSNISAAPDHVYAYIREANKKIYQYQTYGDSDKIMYDFTLQIGSPDPNEPNSVLTSIDALSLNGVSYPRYNFSNGYSWIEGIGTNTGAGIIPSLLLPNSQYGDAVYYYFNCFSNTATQTTFIYGDLECTYVFPFGTSTSVNNVSEKEIKIYPNPVINELNIQSPDNYTITMYNGMGQIIFNNRKIVPGVNTINVSNAASGIYYLIVRDSNGIMVKNQKLIKL